MAADEPRAWLVTGVPGAGKSTVAGALARTYDRAVHIEGDVLQRLIVSGAVPPRPGVHDDEATRQMELGIHNQCLLATSFLEAGFTVVLDFVVTRRDRLAMYRRSLEGWPFGLVVLWPDMSVARRRDHGRPDKRVLARWEGLAGTIREELADTGLWLDNGDLSVDETAELIRKQEQEALLR
jgi:predicted kinase